MEDKEYYQKILKEFEMTPEYVSVNKSRFKTTYKELYCKMKDDLRVILLAQQKLVETTGKDIYKSNAFIKAKQKNRNMVATGYISSLYGLDINKPIHKGLLVRTKKVLTYLGINYEEQNK